MGNRWRNSGNNGRLYFWGSKITVDGDCSHEIKRHLLLGRKVMTKNIRQNIKMQRHYFANKGLSSQGYGFSSGHVWTWELDYKERWAPKNWYFWTVVLEKTLESPLDCKEIQPVHPKGDQSWVFIEGLMLKLKLQYFGHLMWRADSFEKTLMLGKIEGDDRGWDGWMASPTQWTWLAMDREAWRAAVHGVAKSWTRLSWTEGG